MKPLLPTVPENSAPQFLSVDGGISELNRIVTEQNLRNVLAQAPVAMCLYRGANFIVEIVNKRMLEIWGKTIEDVINKPVFEGMPEAKGQGFETLLQNVYTTGESFSANEISINLFRNNKIEKNLCQFSI